MNHGNFYKKILAAALAITIIAGSLSIYAFRVQAAINKEINYQGKLTNASNVAVADGTYIMEFKLYTQLSGGVAVWTETLTGTNEVQVTNGLFSVMLGSTTPLTGVDFNQTLYLGVNIESDGEMSPRKIIGAVPAAFVADTVDNLSSEQFLRSDAQNATSSSGTFLNVLQSGAGKIAEFFGATSQSVLSILSSGNVGIGTTTPYAPLSVVGQIVGSYFTGTTTATSTFGGNLAINGTGTTTSAGGVSLSAGCFAINGVCLANSTYGDTSVNAYIHASSTIPKTYTANTFTATSTFSGGLIVKQANQLSSGLKLYNQTYNADPFFGLTISQLDTGETNFNNGGTNFMHANTDGSLTFVGGAASIGDSGDGFFYSGTFGSGAAAINNNGTATFLNGAISLNAGGEATFGNGTSAITSAGGAHFDDMVGIGITSPTRRLTLNGVGTDEYVSFNNSGTERWIVGNEATVSNRFAIFNTVSSAYALVINATTNNIGFGSTTPGTSLSIGNTGANTINISATATSTFGSGINVRTGCFAINGSCMAIGSGTQGQVPYYSGTGSSLAATSSLFIAQNGNVGIGTTSPYAKLSVVGEIVGGYFTATSTATSTFGGNLALRGGFEMNYDVPTETLSIMKPTSPVAHIRVRDLTATEYLASLIQIQTPLLQNMTNITVQAITDLGEDTTITLDSDITSVTGSVGIGTTTPYAKLSVVGQVVGEYFTATSTTATSTFNGNAQVKGNLQVGNSSIYLRSAATSTFDGGISLSAGCFFVNGACLSNNTYGDASVNSYIHASTTIPKTYTANTFTGQQDFNNVVVAGQIEGPGVIWDIDFNGAASFVQVTGPSHAWDIMANGEAFFASVNPPSGNNWSIDTLGNGYFAGKLGVGSNVAPTATLSVKGINGVNPFTVASSTGASLFVVLQNGNVGIGTTTPYAPLSVVGQIVGSYFTGTTTATSTFGGNLAINGTGTTTSAGGVSLSAGCFAINGTCLTNSTYGDTSVNAYIHASTTIPKMYTANIFSALQTFTAGLTTNALTLGSLTGPLQAINGLVSASSTLSVAYGGTGLSTAPSYGQLLLGNASSGYTLTATSSLGLASALSGTGIVTNIGSTQSTLSTSSLPVNVRDYGATGDGSTDDTAFIQTAINVATSTQRPLYIPKGIYKITSDLILSTGNPDLNGFKVYGDGSYATLHNSAPTNIYVVNSGTGSNGFKILGNSNHVSISDINFSGSPLATSTGYAIYADGTDGGGGSVDSLFIENVSVNRMNGIFASAVSNSTFIQFVVNGGQGGCAVGAFFATGVYNTEANNADYWNGNITGCTVGWHLQSGIGFHIQSSDAGASQMETALLMDGMNNVSVANSNWEMYSVGSTTIENLSASKTLSIRDSQIRAFGPQNGKYSIIKGANALVLENTFLEYVGEHGGAIKETTTINATVVSSGAYTTKVESFNSLGGTWYGNYVASSMRTDSQSSGLGASASTIGTMWQRVGSSTISTLNFGAQRSDNATYEWVDMLKYWKDTTVNNLTVIGNVSPTYGMIPVGNASAGYTLMSTSSLNISGGGTIGSGVQGQFPFYDGTGNTLTATSSLFVSQAGGIGIGTNVPGYKLQIQGPTSGTGAMIVLTNGAYAGGATATFFGLPLASNQGQQGSLSGDTVLSAKGGGSIKFGTNLSGSSAITRMSIDTIGRTCIGYVDCPMIAMLNIASTTATTLFRVNGVTNDMFNVQGTGNVGVGTTTPWRTLSVNGNSDLGNDALAGYFTATSTTASQFPYASTTMISAITASTSVLNLPNTASATYGLINVNSTRFLHKYGDVGNLFIGSNAGNFTMSGATQDMGVGTEALDALTSGDYNVAFGPYAGSGITSGSSNMLIGNSAGFNLTTQSNNVGIGDTALLGVAGSGNVAIGREAMRGVTGTPNNNTFLGMMSGSTVSGDGGLQTASVSNSTAIGAYSYVGASNAMVLGSTGTYGVNVGIGTTSPYARLSVHAGATDTYRPTLFSIASSTAAYATTTIFTVLAGGNVGVATTTPWKTLSVTGTMAINGLTGSTGGGSLCLSASNEVVYNSGSDACLPSLRDTKHDIQDLSVDALSLVSSLNPSSFVYNSGDQRVRYGFIAEEAQTIDPHLVTYSAAGELSGIDDRAVTSLLVKALQEQQIQIASVASSSAPENIIALGQGVGALNEKINAVEASTTQAVSLGIQAIEKYDSMSKLLSDSLDNINKKLSELSGNTQTYDTQALASSTADILASSTPSFIVRVAHAVQEYVQSAGEWVVSKITAQVALFDRVETKIAAISRGLEMTDQETGDVYCVSIKDGDWDKVQGLCTEDVLEEIPVNTDVIDSDATTTDSTVQQTDISDDSATTTDTTVQIDVFDSNNIVATTTETVTQTTTPDTASDQVETTQLSDPEAVTADITVSEPAAPDPASVPSESSSDAGSPETGGSDAGSESTE